MKVARPPRRARDLRVGIGGLGAIGLPVARALDRGIPGLVLAAVSAADKGRAAEKIAGFKNRVPIVELDELAKISDVVVECAPPQSFRAIARSAVEAGRIFIPLSITSLLEELDLVEIAKRTGARILAPTGALLGLDAVRAVAEGEVHSVVMITRKPPAGLRNAKFVVEQGIDLDSLTAPLCLYEGTVRAAARQFPANVNVSVALSLAGIGPDRTRYEVWADPALTRNTHTVKVEADSCRFEMTIEGIPTVENPATGKLTPLSVIAMLRGLVSPFRVGT
ncbi:MAG: aspartate dehydrogenase [Rhodospirillales bacterium]|nr:aspartate dehydrogenase [Rhodospirillales bacterium]